MSLRRPLGLAVSTALAAGVVQVLLPAVPAHAAALTATLVRSVDTGAWATPSPDPAGITYLPASGQLLISDSEVDEMPLYAGTNLFLTGLDGTPSPQGGGTTVPWSYEPAGVAFDEARGTLFVSDDDADRIFQLQPGADGRFGTADDGRTSFSARPVRNGDAEDVSVELDPTSNGHLLVIDGHDRAVYDWGPGPDGAFDAVPPTGDDTVSSFDISRFGALDPEGIAVHPARRTLLVLDRGSGSIFEVSRSGVLVNTIDISAAQPRSAAGITLAPPSDGSGGLNLYLVDRGVDNNSDPAERDGRLYEMSVTLPPLPANLPPYAYAGPDRSVKMPSSAGLNGALSDDGQPAGSTATAAWSKVSGPGEVTFADPAAAATRATFTAEGTYVLRLSATDGDLAASDDVTVEVSSWPAGVFEASMATTTDDAEERSASVSLTGSDLELVTDGGTVQKVGLRFPEVMLEPRATITDAYVQFSVDEATTETAGLAVHGQAADDAQPFAAVSKDVSSRPRTAATISWSPPGWPTAGERGPDQRTPNLAPILQEIVNRPGWTSGNAVALVITGSGTRTAASFERGEAKAPVLHLEFGPPSDTNATPIVSAGPDAEVTMPTEASLGGWVVDDGLPMGSEVAVEWSKVQGPGDVVFDDSTAEVTTATFSAAGTYVLRLTGDDGELQSSDDVTVQVSAPSPGLVEVPVSAGSDDAEERSASVSLTGTDLELVADGTTVQTVGLRFPAVAVPPGAAITAAYVQFSVDEASTAAADLTVAGQAADDPPTFVNAAGDISSRPRTVATVVWTPEAWPVNGDRGSAQRTPDLSAILREIVRRPGWTGGNAVVLVLTGSGTRTAVASERGVATAPVLHVEFDTGTPAGPANTAPTADAGPDLTVALPVSAELAGSVADDGFPDPPGAVSAAWTTVSGPGTVTFADPAAASTTATFDAAGEYVLRLTAGDGALQASDDVVVTVADPLPPPPAELQVPVATGADDAEERSASVSIGGTDLELVVDGTTVQTVGLRFAAVAVPPGATITGAYLQFSVDEATAGPADLLICGQAVDDAPVFAAVSKDISSRARTAATVPWTPPAWPARGDRGPEQRTPDLAAILQEIVDRPGWADGHAVVLVITGSGTRTAAAAERGEGWAPVLHVAWSS